MAENHIELKSVRELLEMKFFIPSYQRGYRWTEQQVKDLLNDIWEFSKKKKTEKEFYCLQPLVVKRKEENILKSIKAANSIEEVETLLKGSWEVIDGQQRLTTLYILLSELGVKNPFFLKYETRDGSERYLNNINDLEKDNNIDYQHIFQSNKVITDWFSSDKEKILEFRGNLLDNVKFIWYESIAEDPVKVFTRLNIGKISLTNAELIKALFLNRSNFGEHNDEYLRLRQQEIASEWDTIEYTLQNDEFWLFLRNLEENDTKKQPTRIDFIFDLICGQQSLGTYYNVGNDEYRTFRYFYEYFKKSDSNIVTCWAKVKRHFQTFQEWFDDLDLYHYVGYLIENSYNLQTLVNEWSKAQDKDSFVAWLKGEIKTITDKYPLDYQFEVNGSDKKNCKPILLFHNIQTVINQNRNFKNNENYQIGVFYKFPFHLYKHEGWDVEHIDSNTTNPEEDGATQKEWLLNTYLSVNENLQTEIKACFEKGDNVKNLFERIKSIIPLPEKWSPEEKNRIWNYALLDSSTNRGYGNSIFSGKRRVIIGKDKGLLIPIPEPTKDGKIKLGEAKLANSSFVPPCSKQVFMKYFSATMTDPNYWTKVDAKAYMSDIENCLKELDTPTQQNANSNE